MGEHTVVTVGRRSVRVYLFFGVSVQRSRFAQADALDVGRLAEADVVALHVV